jgi:toxin CptA
MDIALTSLAFLVAAVAAGVMGFAIQRGATCTVAAVAELVANRRANRLVSLIEAAIWVAGGLVVLQALHGLSMMPVGYELTGWTVLGAAMLGLGAFVNRACVFGAIARFGSGQWTQALMPVGFFAACISFKPVFALPMQMAVASVSPVLQMPQWLAALFLLFAAWRIAQPLFAPGQRAPGHGPVMHVRHLLQSRIWTPHAATTVIAITFLLTLVLAGSWAYTDLLADIARGRMARLAVRGLLVLALLAGAVWGGWTAGRFKSAPLAPVDALRSFAGGVLMGWGSLMIPGGNDSLILVGMPLLWSYAWAAFLTMALSIALAIMLTDRMRRPQAGA